MKRFDPFPEWSKGCWQDRAPVIPAARSFALLHDKAPSGAVLLVHGYAGYPGELVSPAEALYEAGYDCFVPRLPGMGTSGKDFIHTTRYDWTAVVGRALDFLCQNYSKVAILGHSMGCLLAVVQATVHPVAALVLAMPPFLMPALKKGQLIAASLMRKELPTAWSPDPRYRLHYEDAPCDDMALGKEYYSHIYPRQLLQLARLIGEVGKARSRLKTPTLIIASRSDSICDSSAVDEWSSIATIRWIEGATHYVFYDIDPRCEEEAIAAGVDHIVRFLG